MSELDYFLDTDSRNQGTGSFLSDHAEGGVAAKLPVVVGDEYFDGKLENVDFIKIDIEGFEAPALQGLRKTLLESEPIIMMEVTESSAKLFEEFGGVEAVMPFEFDVWRVSNPKCALGVFEMDRYELTRMGSVAPGKASFNIMIVPKSRAVEFRHVAEQ